MCSSDLFAVLAGRPGFPAGLIPFSMLVLMETFASYILILAVALISESQGWTIGATVFGELFLQVIMYVASHDSTIAATMKGNRIVWSPPAVHILLGEVGTILLMLGLTLWGVRETPSKRLATLGPHGDVECVFKIGRRFAQAELLFLEGQVRLVVLVKADAHTEPHWPRR